MTERIWLQSYPAGVPSDIDPGEYNSLVALMEESFTKFADRTAYSFMGRDVSYAETNRLSGRLATYLQSLGLARGDRVPPALQVRPSAADLQALATETAQVLLRP